MYRLPFSFRSTGLKSQGFRSDGLGIVLENVFGHQSEPVRDERGLYRAASWDEHCDGCLVHLRCLGVVEAAVLPLDHDAGLVIREGRLSVVCVKDIHGVRFFQYRNQKEIAKVNPAVGWNPSPVGT